MNTFARVGAGFSAVALSAAFLLSSCCGRTSSAYGENGLTPQPTMAEFYVDSLVDVNPREAGLTFWSHPDNYLYHQRIATFRQADRIFRANAPVIMNGGSAVKACQQESFEARMMAMIALDEAVHDYSSDYSPELIAFVNHRVKAVAEDLINSPRKGAHLYKLYNDSFILQSGDEVIAIDIVRGGRPLGAGAPNKRSKNLKQPFLRESLVDSLLSVCDFMIGTHNHIDHRDPYVESALQKAGKAFYHVDNHYGGEDIITAGGIRIQVFPGHQVQLLNNNYVITLPNGFKIAFTGDQDKDEDKPAFREFTAAVGGVDVLVSNGWFTDLAEVAACYCPKLLITGHENELGHSIDHRESFWQSAYKCASLPYNWLLMAWGEGVELK